VLELELELELGLERLEELEGLEGLELRKSLDGWLDRWASPGGGVMRSVG